MKNSFKRCAIIMAGGSGERFWPISRKRKPKQLLKLSTPDMTMLEESIERVSGLIAPEDIFIITGELLLEPIRNSLPLLPPENVVAEPFKRNTAPCLALGAAFIAAKYGAAGISPEQISIAVLTADQEIQPVSAFRTTIEAALSHVEQNDCICTIGIPPARPETGYGYIEVSEAFDKSIDKPEIKPVVCFREKPNREQAVDFMKRGNFLWNSGMFFWRLDYFIKELSLHLPEVGLKIPEMQSKYTGKTDIPLPEPLSSIAGIFEKFPNESIDYGLMEKTGNVAVVKALFKWDDIGSWDSLERVKTSDEDGNIVEGAATIIDSKDTILINNSENGKMIVAALGLTDFVVVATDDAVLVCPKNRVQEVKKCVEEIRAKGGDKWL